MSRAKKKGFGLLKFIALITYNALIHTPQLTPKSDIWSIGIMIYEAILRSARTDLDKSKFYNLRGVIDIRKIIYELNYMYKYDKIKWIAKRAVRKLEK
jgi:serine/threonine protein kinase